MTTQDTILFSRELLKTLHKVLLFSILLVLVFFIKTKKTIGKDVVVGLYAVLGANPNLTYTVVDCHIIHVIL